MNKLKEMFGEEWFNLFEPFLYSKEFTKILNLLKKDLDDRRVLTPLFEDVFRAFKECPFDKLNTIILGMEPYSGLTQDKRLVSDGLAFSSKASFTCPYELDKIYDTIDEDFKRCSIDHGIIEDTKIERTSDLTRWAKQGILLLNCSLTTNLGYPGSHMDIWQPFIKFVLRQINNACENVCIIFVGRYAQNFTSLLNNRSFNHYVCEHPRQAQGRNLECNECFSQVHYYHVFMNNIKLEW